MKLLLIFVGMLVGILIGNNISVAIDLLRPHPDELGMIYTGKEMRAFGYNPITNEWLPIKVSQHGKVICNGE